MLGYFREFFFLQTNIVMYNKWSNSNYPVKYSMSWMNHFEYWTIYYAKWIFTLLFIIAFYFLQRLILHYFAVSRFNLTLLLNAFYVTLFTVCVMAVLIGLAFGNFAKGYSLSRIIAGILQSPVAIMVIIPLGLYYKKIEKL